MNLQIISNGDPFFSKIIDTDTGFELINVQELNWKMSVKEFPQSRCFLTLVDIPAKDYDGYYIRVKNPTIKNIKIKNPEVDLVFKKQNVVEDAFRR